MPRDNYDRNIRLMTRMAWMHYIQGMTHAEIAKKLDFSRSKVTRMLLRAKEIGIVEIKIKGAYSVCVELEEELKEKTGLYKVIVVPSGETDESTSESVDRGAADYLNENLVKGDILGVAWGMSFAKIGPYLERKPELSLKTVQLMGGIANSGEVDPQGIMGNISRKLGADGMMKPIPVMVGSKEIKNTLLQDKGIKEMMLQANKCTKALIGTGGVTKATSSLCRLNLVKEEDLEEMRKNGIVGDIIGWFGDKNGIEVHNKYSDRIMSTILDVLKIIPEKILMTAGVGKKEPLIAAIRGGYVDTIIIDEELAETVNEAL